MQVSTPSESRPFSPWRTLFLATIVGTLAGCAMHAAQPPRDAEHYRVVGYDTVRTDIDSKDAGKIDTLIFAFAKLVNGEVVLEPDDAQRLHRLITLKAANPQLKVVVSVGGWGAGGFSEAASTTESRQRFASSAAQL